MHGDVRAYDELFHIDESLSIPALVKQMKLWCACIVHG